jgi:hypothetical protein
MEEDQGIIMKREREREKEREGDRSCPNLVIKKQNKNVYVIKR